MLRAVQIGAGNIGRGFLGHIYYESGCETTFLDTNGEIVARLQARHEYPLRLVGPGPDDADRNITIGRVAAIDPRADSAGAVRAIASADIVGTSVGARFLPQIASLLAESIGERARRGGEPLNILLCENQRHCSDVMRDLLEAHIAPDAAEFFRTQIGLVETVIGRMVPVPTSALITEDRLLITAEPYMKLPLAAAMVRGDLPPLCGALVAEPFAPYEAQKLFMHNAAHAALAYVGYLSGLDAIWEAAQDMRARTICEGVLAEVAEAMLRAFPDAADMDSASLTAYSKDLTMRFENKRLGDTIARVAADPMRKLGPSDRLIGAARFCQEHGVRPNTLATAVAAALRYDHPADLSCSALQELRQRAGDRDTLRDLCGLSDQDSFLGEVVRAGENFPTAD